MVLYFVFSLMQDRNEALAVSGWGEMVYYSYHVSPIIFTHTLLHSQ